jgi:hypothetical protein
MKAVGAPSKGRRSDAMDHLLSPETLKNTKKKKSYMENTRKCLKKKKESGKILY